MCNVCSAKTIWENEMAGGGKLSVKFCAQLEAENECVLC